MPPARAWARPRTPSRRAEGRRGASRQPPEKERGGEQREASGRQLEAAGDDRVRVARVGARGLLVDDEPLGRIGLDEPPLDRVGVEGAQGVHDALAPAAGEARVLEVVEDLLQLARTELAESPLAEGLAKVAAQRPVELANAVGGQAAAAGVADHALIGRTEDL